MPLKPKTLRVVPNPYHHLDENGRPCALVPWDPIGHNPGRGFVGARLTAVETKAAENVIIGGRSFEGSPAQHELGVEYEHDPVTIPETPYYLAQLRQGALLPADAATAKAAGRKHVDHEEALEAERDAACERWVAQAHEYHPPGEPEAARAHLHGAALGAHRELAAKKESR